MKTDGGICIALKRMDAIVTEQKMSEVFELTRQQWDYREGFRFSNMSGLSRGSSSLGVPLSTYSRWRTKFNRGGFEALIPRYANCGRKRKAALRG